MLHRDAVVETEQQCRRQQAPMWRLRGRIAGSVESGGGPRELQFNAVGHCGSARGVLASDTAASQHSGDTRSFKLGSAG